MIGINKFLWENEYYPTLVMTKPHVSTTKCPTYLHTYDIYLSLTHANSAISSCHNDYCSSNLHRWNL